MKSKFEIMIDKIARQNNTTTSFVHEEMNRAILIAFCDPDPSAQEFWNNCPSKNAVPTAEEVIRYLATVCD